MTDRPPAPDPLALADLAGAVTGVVLTPGQPGYDEERAPFNLALESHPAVVVGAVDAADVQAAVRFARAHDLPVAVMTTGHQASVPVDAAVLVTTRRMSDVRVDPLAATVTVGAGVVWQQVVDATTAYGLAPLNGSSPLVGVVGYTLGGGLSPMLGRAFGWAADALRSMTVVTADGELHEVSAHAPDPLDADLFWGLPGAKSNLGIVTSMTFGLFPVTHLHAGGLFFAGADLAAVLTAYAALTAAAPDELTTSIALLRMPPVPFVPEFLRGTFMVHVRVSLLGTAEQAGELLRPLRAAAPALLDTVADMPYADFASIHADPSSPAPWREHSALLGPLTPGAIDTLVEVAGPDADVPVQMLQLRHLGGALARGEATTNAAARRHAEFVLDAIAIGPVEVTGGAMSWTRGLVDRLADVRVPGTNLNFLGAEDASPAEVAAAHDPAVLARLRQVKRAVDPHNTFRINHNITPAEDPR
ncbi:FAD-binding oxidoreductase [Modestobacter sp. VKM Ac-2986]|uniref:FAD-binding oxidoreductase n=1 Tax=Modestobacter sp. VKM Ac-2986 TaxID=3004140 RepID=UPI0022AAE91C|nr:FAD-binding oxidoreductase [Modestobacter sp. VKM Ac-2986]MCZ2828880.1 FAD-binding oxidoreductase [Modestobacter sp. VKM Ac-2986]